MRRIPPRSCYHASDVRTAWPPLERWTASIFPRPSRTEACACDRGGSARKQSKRALDTTGSSNVYRLAIAASSPETDKAVLSRAHESMGRINAFLENKDEAMKSFDEAIKLGDVRGGAYREALEGKKKLSQP